MMRNEYIKCVGKIQRFVILMQVVDTVIVSSRVNGLQVSGIAKMCNINSRLL